jgi:tetratricopeptide (TPR) repeat protein
MAPEKWFCNEEWNPTVEEHFFKKLRRARDKAQYLKIQAGCLCKKHPQVALALLEKFFALDSNSIFGAEAFLHQAEAHLSLGAKQKAIESFQKALQRQREFPNVITAAWSESLQQTLYSWNEIAQALAEDSRKRLLQLAKWRAL